MTVVFRNAFLMLTVVSVAAGGQSGRRPPTPPTPPSPPTPVAPPAPVAIRPLRLDRDYIDLERLRVIDADEIRRAAQEASRAAMEQSRMSMEASREMQRAIAEASREASRQAAEASREATRQAVEAARIAPQAYRAARDAMGNIESLTPVPLQQIAPSVYSVPSRYNTGPFYQSDPADSLFRRASSLIEANDYRAAAQRFKEVQTKYPSSRYVQQAMYWQAFALYRSDTDAELREALSVLEQFLQKYPNARFTGENGYLADASALTQRIRGTLARRGDAAAARQVSQAAGAGATCDREELQVKQEALSALWRMNPEEAAPKFEQVLARRDECSLDFRRFALRTVTQRGDGKAVALLLNTAKSDPSTQMRADAVSYVARYPNDDVLATLEQIAKSEENESIRRSAARSLVGYPSPRARTIVRTFVEDNSMSDNMRCEILNRFNDERGTQEDATWMRASYSKVTSPQVRRCMVTAIANIGGAESQKWLMDLAGNEQESSTIRGEAFRRTSQSMSIADLSRAYDNAGNRPMRSNVIQILNQRKEPEALDKLVDILKKTSDFEIRRSIIQMLSNRSDPKAKQAINDIIDK